MSKRLRNAITIAIFFITAMVVNSLSVFSATTYYDLAVVDGVSVNGEAFKEGDMVTITADEIEGETFNRWESNSEKVVFLNKNATTTAFEMPAEDVVITAYYAEEELDDNDANGDGDNSGDSGNSDSDSDGSGDSGSDNSGSNDDDDDDGTGTLYRVIIQNDYTDTQTTEYYRDGETVSIAAKNYTYADFYRWTTTSSGVTFDNSRSKETTFKMPARNVVIIANYEDIYETYEVTVIDGYGDGDYEVGERVYIEAIPTSFEAFSHWTSTSDVEFRDYESSETYFYMIDEPVRVVARYDSIVQETFTASVSSGLGSGTYMEGDIVTIQASPGQGQEFLYWASSPAVSFYNQNSAITSFIMPDSNVAVYPIFQGSDGSIVGNYGYNTNNSTGGESHLITTSVLGNGKIYPSGNIFVNRLAGQSFTMIADPGYEVAFVIIDGQPMGSLSEYTFSNVVANHTIQVVFKDITSNTVVDYAGNPFSDVKTNYWFYNAVMEVYQKGLMVGTSTTTFSPYQGVSRATIASILYRIENSPPVYLSNTVFTDIYPNLWYTNSVIWCYENAIMGGYENGSFAPERILSREELSAVLHRYGNLKGMNMSRLANLTSYADANDVGFWAKTSMSWALGSNLMYGKEFGFIQPKADTTRAELSVIMVELLSQLGM